MNAFFFNCLVADSKMTHFCAKKGHTLFKKFLLKFNFRDKGHLYANSSFCILLPCLKCLLIQFFSRGIHMDISILTVVQKLHNSRKKWLYFVKRCTLEA